MNTNADFMEKVEVVEGGCWEWQGFRVRGGYGGVAWPKAGSLRDCKSHRAHRVAYMLFVGPLDPELQIDHLCNNRLCVNPDHLEQVTQQVNLRRAEPRANARKTHCIRGHEFSPENTRLDKGGHRVCKACMRMHWRAWKARQKEMAA